MQQDICHILCPALEGYNRFVLRVFNQMGVALAPSPKAHFHNILDQS
jgi:hypothetical protein